MAYKAFNSMEKKLTLSILIFIKYLWGNDTNSEIYTYDFNHWINKLLSEKNKVLRALFEARKVAGSATYKQSETVWNCVAL